MSPILRPPPERSTRRSSSSRCHWVTMVRPWFRSCTPRRARSSRSTRGDPALVAAGAPRDAGRALGRIADATISAGETVTIERRLPEADGVVSLRLYPPPPPCTAPPGQAEMPDEWLTDAVAFVCQPAAPTARLWAGVDVVSFELPSEHHLELLHRCRATTGTPPWLGSMPPGTSEPPIWALRLSCRTWCS